MTTSISELVYTTKARAEGVRKRTDDILYSVLADCLLVAERCAENPDHQVSLRVLFKQRPPPSSKKRHYVERQSDDFQIVCRLVFASELNASSIYRYAVTIRQAFKRGIKAKDFVSWISVNGGINELYLSRPLDAEHVRTKCLRLNSVILVEKGKPFTLTLVRLENNTYSVLNGGN